MKKVLNHLLLALTVCGGVCAQEAGEERTSPGLDDYMETGMEVSGVRAPYYDEAGRLQAELYGAHAKILENGVAEVTNLRIDVYADDAVVMTVFAPQCYTRVVEQADEKILQVESDGDVLIEMEQMTISGRGFSFTSNDSRFEILSEAKVLVREAAHGMKGVEL